MKLKILRNLGGDWQKRLAAAGVKKVSDFKEGAIVDTPAELGAELLGHGLASEATSVEEETPAVIARPRETEAARVSDIQRTGGPAPAGKPAK